MSFQESVEVTSEKAPVSVPKSEVTSGTDGTYKAESGAPPVLMVCTVFVHTPNQIENQRKIEITNFMTHDTVWLVQEERKIWLPPALLYSDCGWQSSSSKGREVHREKTHV